MGQVLAISISDRKGVKKHNVDSAHLIKNFGIKGDVHAGEGHRQVSLLAVESIDKMLKKGLSVGSGDFAENITTKGIDLLKFKVGDQLRIGEILLEVTQIGKVCHDRCAIYYQAGDCVMPKEGIFARVVKGGTIKPDDKIIGFGHPL